MKITVINNRKEEAVVEIPDDGVLLDVKKAAEKVWGIPVNKQNITREKAASSEYIIEQEFNSQKNKLSASITH
ncbi:hypothetical protein PHET_01729 [Paragonimus heterotremus]|uniref:Uncharacterized protein n=1 Tax=Paragonimus heterotremus TaxID=100268 RepID=A0A8J4WUB9_9TREM|nr:hypothetical protein PHET_01729 [Paragonimus heterotremus]